MEVSDLFPVLELRTRASSIQKDFHMNGFSNPKPVMKSYAQAISSTIAPVSSAPKKKGDYVAIKVNPKAYEEWLKLCSYSLIGRVVLSKKEEPWKCTTNAQIWVQFYNLPWEFWHPEILLDMACGIEIPLKFDIATLEGDYGHFARMLIDVDLSKPLPDSIMIEKSQVFKEEYLKNIDRKIQVGRSSLIDIAGSDLLWLVIGDFKSVIEAHETTDNISTISCYDFCAALIVYDLVDFETKGVFHTQIGRGRRDQFGHPLSLEWHWDCCSEIEAFEKGFKEVELRGNFLFKVITKIIADRLAKICSRIISPNQYGFIRGRQIGDCIVGASECFNVLNNCSRGRHLALKIDIRKAFDSISWRFILEVLQCFGFFESFIRWVASIFSSGRISVLINGSPQGYFPYSCGIRQGDPLSPLLFYMAEDFLNRYLTYLVDSGSMISISSPVGIHALSHFLFVDDVILICRASLQNLQNLFLTGSIDCRKSVQVAWKSYCRSKDGGGLGVKDLGILSKTLLKKFTWRMLTEVRFWSNNWLGKPLIYLVEDRSSLQPLLDSVMGDIYSDAMGWNISNSFKASYLDVAYEIENVVVSTDPDSLVWTCSFVGSVSCKYAYTSLSEIRSSVFWEVDLRNIFLDFPFVLGLWDVILQQLHVSSRPSKAPCILEVNWQPPQSGCFKVNTDGAAFGSPGLAGCAGIFYTCRGFVKGCLAIPLGVYFTFEVELAPAVYAFDYAWTFGLSRL
ncbi:hypothetical protein Ddye_005411 [Dipteronia dyeriana]|uniref:Reverse transcriptase domain-containing protein n=1 Tax=Dipteronia dyeriana TaxID=168575 RepID=A0AAD9XGE8_9ROSI|nr:hypothetical protein Ddye_005411 [Dipteronia dyeriana]